MHVGKGNGGFKCSEGMSSGFRSPRGDRKSGGLHNKVIRRRVNNGDFKTSGATYNAVYNEAQAFLKNNNPFTVPHSHDPHHALFHLVNSCKDGFIPSMDGKPCNVRSRMISLSPTCGSREGPAYTP